MRDKQHFLR